MAAPYPRRRTSGEPDEVVRVAPVAMRGRAAIGARDHVGALRVLAGGDGQDLQLCRWSFGLCYSGRGGDL
jgi:hypothetical protein